MNNIQTPEFYLQACLALGHQPHHFIHNQPRWWWLLLRGLNFNRPGRPLVAGGRIPQRTKPIVFIVGLKALLHESDIPHPEQIIDVQDTLKDILAQSKIGQPSMYQAEYLEYFNAPTLLMWEQEVMDSIPWLWLWKG